MADMRQMLAAALKSSPQSTAGTASLMDAYNQYVAQAQESGTQPMTFEQFRAQQGV